MKKSLLLLVMIIVLGGSFLWSNEKTVSCSSALVTLEFNNVKLKKIEFVDDMNISYKVNSDSFKVDVKVKNGNIIFTGKNPKKKAKISLYLPKSKTYQTFIDHSQLCKFDHESIVAEIGEGQKVIIKDGTVKVLGENNTQIVSVGGDGIFVNDEDQLVKIDKNGIYIKNDDEDIKEYNGFWARLLSRTITGFTGLVMDLSLKNIGKNVVKIINEQNLRVVADKMNSINVNVSLNKYQRQINKNIIVKKPKQLFIEGFNGDISINGTKGDTLKIKAVKYSNKEKDLKKIKVEFIEKDNKIKIHTYAEDQLIEGGVKVSVSCPKNISIEDISTSNGDIVIKNVKGNLNAITANGKITLVKFNGNVKALTSNGKIFAEKISGEANLVTSNGSIDAKKISDLVTAKTTNGKINLQKIALLSDVSSSNSNIYISTNNLLDHTEIKSSNGRITLAIPEDIDLNLKASTSNGEVSIYDLKFWDTKNKYGEFSGKLGSGANKVTIITSNADIIIKRK